MLTHEVPTKRSAVKHIKVSVRLDGWPRRRWEHRIFFTIDNVRWYDIESHERAPDLVEDKLRVHSTRMDGVYSELEIR